LKRDKLVTVGKVIRSQGKKGELRVRLYLEYYPKPFFFKGIS